MAAYIGFILLSLCSVYLAFSAVYNKKDTTNPVFLGMWTSGTILMMIGYWTDKFLVAQYALNLACLSIIWIIKYKYR